MNKPQSTRGFQTVTMSSHNAKKSVECSVCGIRVGNLKVHMITHTGEKTCSVYSFPSTIYADRITNYSYAETHRRQTLPV